jgi:hypothetical protein
LPTTSRATAKAVALPAEVNNVNGNQLSEKPVKPHWMRSQVIKEIKDQ